MIAVVYPQFYGVGGIARYLDSFFENLPTNSEKVYLITSDDGQTDLQYPQLEIIHVPAGKGRLALLQWSWRVRCLLKEMYATGKIRIVNFHFPPLIPGLFLPSYIPIFLTAHTTYQGMSGRFYETKHFNSPWNKYSLAIKMWMESRVFSKTHHVISLTEQGRQEVLTYGYKGPITVIPNGVDIKKFTPNAEVEKDIDVLFCGRIEMRKGSRPMVEVCKQLLAAKPDIKICIVGYGDDDQYVQEELVPLAPAITLTGKVKFDQMLAYYNRSKVYVSTSYYEGLPGTCLEAMAMKLPAVVWDFQFYERLVNHGVTGYVVQPNDYSNMVKQVLSLLAEPETRNVMGENGRIVLRDHYDWSALSPALLQVIKS
ncbi:glycosyltransferase family 4 protein [Methylobacillus sp.]|uniref:glycosyltransferase family 4 protein n=1 Tax=Methylobacillus sp. TaxID=56818 RepID=UPI0012BE1E3C|nr:glycosyltransferase family 4 protein [Methylobacillus sp.]MPS48379.1 glycosyltransferase family 1 protein [Methylobacillus sp.]